jgi:phosphoribosyl 1,2-cyclic phosphodiesterase
MLASGSSGNAGLLQVDDFSLLIDAGLGPRLMANRLADIGARWNHIDAVVLTHTHTDHWKEKTLAFLSEQRLPFYCHADHGNSFLKHSPAFTELKAKGLVCAYDRGRELVLTPALRCRFLPVRHDDRPTYGFRFEISTRNSEATQSLAYLADLGCWTRELAEAISDVDHLALEFNHDVKMEYSSGRPAALIARILGDEGHLSNAQAASLLEEVIQTSASGRLRNVIQLHLSRHCNRPGLALRAAQEIRNRCSGSFRIHTTQQYRVGPVLALNGATHHAASVNSGTGVPSGTGAPPVVDRRDACPSRERLYHQPWLPGWPQDY